MKDFINFFSIITGLFRSIISILLLFLIGFSVFVDNHLLASAFDLLGFDSFSPASLKPMLIGLALVGFIINTIITKNIFKAGTSGNYHLSNLFFAVLFAIADFFLFGTFKNKYMFILLAFNGLLGLNSLLGLVGRYKGIYYKDDDKEEDNEYIEITSDELSNEDSTDSIIINFSEDKISNREESVENSNQDEDDFTKQSLEKEARENSKTLDEAKEAEYDSEDNEPIDESKDKKDESIEEISTNDNEKSNPIDKDKKVNMIEVNESKDKTYDPSLAEDIRKTKENEIYDKSKIIGRKDS